MQDAFIHSPSLLSNVTILFLGLLSLLTMDLSDTDNQDINYHPMDKSSAFLFYQ